jgi:putative ABC transport system substrate-binding protein
MRRRQFVILLGLAPLSSGSRAQGAERTRRVALLMEQAADYPEQRLRVAAFMRALGERGWAEGRNLAVDYRWGAGDAGQSRALATELVGIKPDVILAASTPAVSALLQATRTIPVVFVNVADPVGAGLVASASRPGANATGFTVFEYGVAAKWLELLKEVAPQVKQAAVLRDAAQASGIGQFAAVQTIAPSLGVELRPINVREASEIERSINEFAGPSRGLIVTGSPLTGLHSDLITSLAARHRMPAVYPYRHFVANGGLISYGPDQVDAFRLAADYVDRILKGEKPEDLPVQAPTRYELAVNTRAARSLGLTIPTALLTRADEVIE